MQTLFFDRFWFENYRFKNKFVCAKIVKCFFSWFFFFWNIVLGMEVALIVGIDFTRSNLDPSDPKSLHYFNAGDRDGKQLNDYVTAIRSVGEILQHYDSDKKYPVYGFGAKFWRKNTILNWILAFGRCSWRSTTATRPNQCVRNLGLDQTLTCEPCIPLDHYLTHFP